MKAAQIVNKVMSTAVRRRRHNHDLRHTAVSLSIAGGATDLEVAKWAGHRSVSFTKDRYGHLFPEPGEVLADRLDAFIEAATSTPAARVWPLRRYP